MRAPSAIGSSIRRRPAAPPGPPPRDRRGRSRRAERCRSLTAHPSLPSMAKSAGKLLATFSADGCNPIFLRSLLADVRVGGSRAHIFRPRLPAGMLDFEAALADAEAEVGISPALAPPRRSAACVTRASTTSPRSAQAAAPAGNVAIPLRQGADRQGATRRRAATSTGAPPARTWSTPPSCSSRGARSRMMRADLRGAIEALAGLIAAHRGDADAGAHADAAGAADHLRLQGGGLALRPDAAPTRACGGSRRKRWRCSSAARPERSPRSATTGLPCARALAARLDAAGADDHLARRAQPHLRHRRRARRPLRRLRQDRHRRAAPDADGGRRGLRAGRRRQGRLLHHAAQAQSGRRDRHPRQSPPHRRADGDARHGPGAGARARRRRLGGRMGDAARALLPLRRQHRAAARDARRPGGRPGAHAAEPRRHARPAAGGKPDDGARPGDRPPGARTTWSRRRRSRRWPKRARSPRSPRPSRRSPENSRPRRSTRRSTRKTISAARMR